MVIGIRIMIGLMLMGMMVIGIRMMVGLMMMSLVATFLYHSAPVPLPPLRPLGHGGDF